MNFDKILKWLEAALLSVGAIFAPIQSLLITTAAMIVIDLVTGILAARKRGEKITSAGLRRTVSKIFVYELAIMVAYLGEHYMSDVVPFVKLASGMIAMVEIKSIYENLSAIGGDQASIKSLVDQLGSANQDKS